MTSSDEECYPKDFYVEYQNKKLQYDEDEDSDNESGTTQPSDHSQSKNCSMETIDDGSQTSNSKVFDDSRDQSKRGHEDGESSADEDGSLENGEVEKIDETNKDGDESDEMNNIEQGNQNVFDPENVDKELYSDDFVAGYTLTAREIWNREMKMLDHTPNRYDIFPLTTKKILFFEFKNAFGHSYPSDGYQWNDTTKGIRPSSDKFMENGTRINVVRCKNVSNPLFQKWVIKNGTSYKVRYVLLGGTIDVLNDHKNRLTSKQTNLIRDKCIGAKGWRFVQKQLAEEGHHFDRDQILNQSKTIPAYLMQKRKTGPRPTTNPGSLANFQTKRHASSEIWQGEINGKRCWMLMDCFEDFIKLFAKLCPTRQEYAKHKEFLKKIRRSTGEKRQKLIADFLLEYPDNYKFRNRLILDSTFMLSDCYLTVLIAEIGSKFRTKNKKNNNSKSRFVPVAWCLHSNRDLPSHSKFADFLHKKFKSQTKNTVIPCIITDGEASFSAYTAKLGWPHLRCELHLRQNLISKLEKDGVELYKLLFGERDDGNWSVGALGAGSFEEFVERIAVLEQSGKLNENMLKWLDTRKEWLFDQCSLYSKFEGGFLISFSTSNQIESWNCELKQRLGKRTTADIVAQLLVNLQIEESSNILQSMQSNSPNIICIDADEIKKMTTSEKKDYFAEIGWIENEVMTWKFPPSWSYSLDFGKMRSIELKSQNLIVEETSKVYIVESESSERTSNEFVQIKKSMEGKVSCLVCSKCKPNLPFSFCEHIFAILKNLPEIDREMELLKIGTSIDNKKSEIFHLKSISNDSAGEKSKRKGHQKSHKNYTRTTTRVIDEFDLPTTGNCIDASADSSILEQNENAVHSTDEFDITINSISDSPDKSLRRSKRNSDVLKYTNDGFIKKSKN